MSETKKTKEAEEVEIEKGYNKAQTAAKLRRLADALENNKPFEIQISGKKIVVPVDAEIDFEYEEDGDEKELEIEISWK
jgi:amphi-Trp domain-containing protein